MVNLSIVGDPPEASPLSELGRGRCNVEDSKGVWFELIFLYSISIETVQQWFDTAAAEPAYDAGL